MQISKQQLAPALETEIEQWLVTLLADLKSKHDLEKFLRTFLTETELTVFSKRLAILRLLQENKSYEEISNQLKVSSATISGTSQLREQPIVKKALQRLMVDEWAEVWAEKITKFLPGSKA